ncbi:hypothetical protein L208DRAFT_1128075, partial [Tricholoma matsutake]
HNAEQAKQPSSSPLLRFQDGHPLADSHGMWCWSLEIAHVLEFLGSMLPRFNHSDREYYCCTMLTLFKPWWSGIDLKQRDKSWDDAFSSYSFTERQEEVMRFANIWYECHDAKDDFHALMKQGTA